MKQILCFFARPFAITALAFLALCTTFFTTLPQSFAAPASKGKVIIYNWSEFIPQPVLNDFTKETGIEVIYSTFESNEAMFAKLKLMQGKGYDVVVPSNYLIKQMLDNNLLQEIDHSKIPNLANLDPKLLDQEFDKANKYTIPYMWGAVGLAYNKKYLPEGMSTWADLLNPKLKGRIIMTDDMRDAFGIALKASGLSANTATEEGIKAGYEFLLKLKASIRIFDITATKQALITEEVWAGPIWNGDYLVALEENENLAFVFPKEGSILWMDSFTILKEAENVENAHIFINYMMRPEVAKACIEEYKYSSPNKAAVGLLSEEAQKNTILMPTDTELQNSEYAGGIGAALGIYQKYWEMLKTAR